jgi:N-acylneuraminate cytidylyltransferase
MNRMANIAVITARGGSKRIPHKNIKEFLGKPIIEYSIQAALESELFDEVMVSTDSEEIAGIARKAGAQVPFLRSEKTSDDFATTADVMMEVLETYESRGRTFECAVCIYPTAPFVTADKLKQGLIKLQETGATMLMPVVAFSFPPQRGMVLDKEQVKMKWPENRNVRSQDLETFYHDCGQFYCYAVKPYMELRGQITENIVPLIMPETQVQDIDNMDDWKIAELKYKRSKLQKARNVVCSRRGGTR